MDNLYSLINDSQLISDIDKQIVPAIASRVLLRACSMGCAKKFNYSV